MNYNFIVITKNPSTLATTVSTHPVCVENYSLEAANDVETCNSDLTTFVAYGVNNCNRFDSLSIESAFSSLVDCVLNDNPPDSFALEDLFNSQLAKHVLQELGCLSPQCSFFCTVSQCL